MKIFVGDRVAVTHTPSLKGEKVRIIHGRIVYIHPDKRWFTLETGCFCESFWATDIYSVIKKDRRH